MKKLLSLFCIIVFLLMSAFVLPVSATKTTIIASGNPNDYTQLGRDLYWELDSTGLLRIWGTGPMNAFSNNYGPFVDYRYQINRVIVEEGVTYIGDSAFYGCKNLTSVELAESVEILGMYVFAYSTNLESLTFGKNLWKIGWYTFNGCPRLDDYDAPGLFYTGTPESFSAIQTYGGCEWYYAKKTFITRIYQQPKDSLVKLGEIASTTVKANGNEVKYTWYVKKPGGTFLKDSCTSDTYSFTMTKALSGTQAYCIAENSYGYSVKSDTVTLKIAPAKITKQPSSVKVLNKKSVKFSLNATGEGLTYKWYYKDKNMSSYKYISGFNDNYYTTTMTNSTNGRKVYCVVTDKYGNSVKSNIVSMTMAKPVKITKQPVSVKATYGSKVKISIKASGDGLKYNWYFKNKKSSTYKKSSVKTNSYTTYISDESDGRKIYCIVKDKYGNSVKSKVVSIKLPTPVKITKQPKSVKVKHNGTVKITVNAKGEGLKYNWYYRNQNMTSFKYISSVKGNVYKTTMNSARNGREVYCIVTDKYGNSAYSNYVTMSVTNPLKITKQPKSVTASVGKSTKITVKSNGSGVSYKWYYKDADMASFKLASSVKSKTYKTTMTYDKNGRQVYCIIKDKRGYTVKSDIATISLPAPVRITNQSSPIIKASKGSTAYIYVIAKGDGLKYKWYYMDKNMTYFKCDSSAKTNTYKAKMNSAINGRKVYCAVYDKYGYVSFSNTFTLKTK